MLPFAASSLPTTPAVAVTGFFVAWPAARRWGESGARFFNETNSDGTLRLLARDAWNESGHLLLLEGDATHEVVVRAADEAARVLAAHREAFDATRCAVVFSLSKAEVDPLPDWATPGKENALPVGSAIIATGKDSVRENFLSWTPDAPSRILARRLGAGGAMLSPVAACAGGAHSVILGAQLIEDGRADFAVCGALEAGLSPLMMAGYKSLGALSKSGAMRPFDSARDGFVPHEGLAMLVLENAEIARRRGARVLATIAGSAMNADATSMTAMRSDGSSIVRAIQIAQRKANARLELPLDYVNAHATATKLNDALEARALAQTLGENVAVGATKGATGHWLGAVGALEAALTVLALSDGFLPPCIGLSRRGEDVAALDFVKNGGRETRTRRALSLSYGFGGQIGALIFDAP